MDEHLIFLFGPIFVIGCNYHALSSMSCDIPGDGQKVSESGMLKDLSTEELDPDMDKTTSTRNEKLQNSLRQKLSIFTKIASTPSWHTRIVAEFSQNTTRQRF